MVQHHGYGNLSMSPTLSVLSSQPASAAFLKSAEYHPNRWYLPQRITPAGSKILQKGGGILGCDHHIQESYIIADIRKQRTQKHQRRYYQSNRNNPSQFLSDDAGQRRNCNTQQIGYDQAGHCAACHNFKFLLNLATHNEKNWDHNSIHPAGVNLHQIAGNGYSHNPHKDRNQKQNFFFLAYIHRKSIVTQRSSI